MVSHSTGASYSDHMRSYATSDQSASLLGSPSISGSPSPSLRSHQSGPGGNFGHPSPRLNQHEATAASTKMANKYTRGHQRRQSVARLLPDISKLRLLSWLVEASSELINCDIAIMDGVYAKLNRSRESLLFWSAGQTHLRPNNQSVSFSSVNLNKPPAPPKRQPITSKLVIPQRKPKSNQKANQEARNHHSLPFTNYDSSSLAAISVSRSAIQGPSSGSNTTGAPSAADSQPMLASCSQTNANDTRHSLCDSSTGNNFEDFCDSNPASENEDDDDDDDDNSSASSSMASSGIHGGATSISSASVSSAGSSSPSSDVSSCSIDASGAPTTSTLSPSNRVQGRGSGPFASDEMETNSNLSSADKLSDRIRSLVMEHNYLQGLLVNVIRQHDKQRDRRHRILLRTPIELGQQQLKVDLADISEALDDGCLCICHTELDSQLLQKSDTNRASTLPALSTLDECQKDQRSQTVTLGIQVPVRKMRRLKKLRVGSSATTNCRQNGELSREDIFNQRSDKLCENCFETHYWLHSCGSIEFTEEQRQLMVDYNIKISPPTRRQRSTSTVDTSNSNLTGDNSNKSQSTNSNPSTIKENQLTSSAIQDLNAIISLRNATFIKLVQQQVRSTISKSIELIDLIRREIKSPESIKQKQLMRCFSASIQLLTSVGNYVVPSQDISTFIPEVGQQQTSLFCLPPSDFDHLLIYPPSSGSAPTSSPFMSLPSPNGVRRPQQESSHPNYHLAQAPDIPIRRRFNQMSLLDDLNYDSVYDDQKRNSKNKSHANNQLQRERNLPAEVQKLRTTNENNQVNTTTTAADSSSGASSNNSSASSSIARGTVQQSSLSRAHTSDAILISGAGHGLSFETIANLSRQQTEDDIMFQSRPKFWQSSKFNFIKKLLHVKQERLLRQQSKDRRIYNNKVQNKFRLVMRDLTHFNKSQQLLTTENGVNSLLTSMRNVLEFGLYLTLKLY